MKARNRGFTLIEILVAMSLFTMVGVAVVLLMRQGVDMWMRGNQGSQQEDRVEQSLPRLEEDLRMAYVAPQRDRIPFDPKNPDPQKEPAPLPTRMRFISGYHHVKIGEQDVPCRYLAFVRGLTGLAELDVYAARAGSNPEATSYIDGKNDEAEFAKNDHLPTGGTVEVLWMWLPDPERPGLGGVYRAYRTPVGGPGTLLDPANHDSLEKIHGTIRPQLVFQDVLLFDLYFWTQYTTTWEYGANDPSVTERPSLETLERQGRPSCGPSRTWDSTRGILSKEHFKLARGPASLSFSGDDIYPRMVRVQFAIAEERTLLAQPLAQSQMEMQVDSVEFVTGRGEISYVPMKIGPEWVRVKYRSASARDGFLLAARGILGTASISHPTGTGVYYGRPLDVTISIPAFRDDHN